MNGVRLLVVAGLALVATGASYGQSAGQTPAGYRDYFQAMKRAGMAALIPASSAHGPGYIFRLVKTSDGRTTQRTVCANAFDTPPSSVVIALPSTHRFATDGLNAGLSIAPGAVAQGVSGSLGVQAGQVKTVSMTFGDIASYEVPVGSQVDVETGAVVDRVVNPACMRNLASLRVRNGRFQDKVFIVYRATAANSFRYDLDADGSAGVDLKAEVQDIATGQIGWKVRRVNKQSLEVVGDGSPEHRLYIAADVLKLENARAITAVSKGQPRASLRLRRPVAEDLDAISMAPSR
ncbi:MAG: hypothetical protein JNM47_16330 [Hyphomonadaceae bacterium]|nr:hypothetical protein [Hyphomonadaceae bacterium]